MNLKRGDVGGRPINQRDGLDDFLSLECKNVTQSRKLAFSVRFIYISVYIF